MAPSLLLHFSASTSSIASFNINYLIKPTKISTKIRCVQWDPEGILGAPQKGLIGRLEFKKRLEKDADAREAFERALREEKERRRAERESRVVPDKPTELVEFFLDTEAREIEYEIARLRPRLDKEFFSHLQLELGKLRFAVSRTQDMEDRVIELEALQKALQEGTEAYDKLQDELIVARKSLATILSSEDIKTTLLELVEQNKINRSLLTLLDENIANANTANEKQVADYMEKLRGMVLKYITV